MRTIYLWGILASLCFATTPLVGKIAFLEISVQALLLLRFSVVVAIILLILLFSRRLKTLLVKRKHIPLVLAMSVCLGISNVCFWYPMTFMDVIPLMALFWVYPIFSLILDMKANKVKWGFKSASLIVIGSLGVFLAMGGINW